MNLDAWEKQPELKQDQIRLLWPDGRVWNIWRYQLDDALGEESTKPTAVCHSQEDWKAFLQEQRRINAQWALRNTFNGRSDRRWLMEMGVAWNPPDPKMRALIEAADWDRQQWSLLFMNLIEEHGTKEEQDRLRQMHKESAEETQRNVEKERMELARRISRHQAPGHIE